MKWMFLNIVNFAGENYRDQMDGGLDGMSIFLESYDIVVENQNVNARRSTFEIYQFRAGSTFEILDKAGSQI